MRVRKVHPQVSIATDHGDDTEAQLTNLRLIVAGRLDETDSARESGSLARVLIDIETELGKLRAGQAGAASDVDELLTRRSARGTA